MANKPRGAAQGERRGGRSAETPNRRTLEKQLIAERDKAAEAEIALATTTRTGKKRLAKEVLEDFMHLFAGMAAHYQPHPPTQAKNENENPGLFEKYARLAVDAADRLAPFQSPTFRSVTVLAPPEVPPQTAPQPGAVARLSPQETYRLMKDCIVIEMTVEEEPAVAKRKQARNA